MKKIALCCALLWYGLALGQFNEAAPWITARDESLKADESHKTPDSPLDRLSVSFEAYWKNKDPNKRGSGFKPYKRWENHWQHFLRKDGTLAKPGDFWNAWEQEKEMLRSEVAQWKSIGPYTTVQKYGQGRVNTFIIDPNNPNVYYVGAPSGGLWKSEDYGSNWIPISDEIPQIGVSGIVIDPANSDVIYIATGDDDARDTYSVGVLKSSDGGRSWKKTGLDFSETNAISNEIYMHPENPNILWVATNTGFFKTIDGGENWDYKISINIQDIKVKPGDPEVIYAVSPSKFYKSTDGGDSFKVISNGLPETSGRFAIDVSPDNPEVVYLLSANVDNSFQGLYRSEDSGDSFEKTRESDDIFGGSTQAWYDMALTVNPEDADMVFVGVLDIWRSTDGGNNFAQMNRWYDRSDDAYTHADIHFLRYFNNKLYAGTDGGIYESPDDAASFKDLTETLNISQYYRISTAARNSKKVVGGLQDNGGFAYDNETWNQYHDGDGMDCVVDRNDENVFYGFSQFGGRLNVTYNSGKSPGGSIVEAPGAEAGEGDPGGNWVTPLASNSKGELYAGYSRLYRLDNSKWSPVSPRMFGGDLNYVAIAPSNDEVIYLSRSNRLFKSVNAGTDFEEIDFRFPSLITSIEVNGQDENWVYVTTGGEDGKVFSSTDSGLNWEEITANLPVDSKLVVRHQHQSPLNDLYLGTSVGVYHRNDNMSQWERFDEGLPNSPVFDMEINEEDGILTVGTYGRGVWQSPIEVRKVARDLSLLAINSNNTVQCSGLTPVITVKNNGTEALNSFTVNYRVDGKAYSYGINQRIEPEQSVVIELPNNPEIEIGRHELEIELSASGDAFDENNLLYASFRTNRIGEGQYVNTFGDLNEDIWLTETKGNPAELWNRGEPTSQKFRSKFDNSYATNIDGEYFDDTTAYLISPCYDLSRLENPILKFDMIYDIEENWDVLYVEYSTDSGGSWNILGSAEDPNWYNSAFIDPERPITVGAQWTGTDITPKQYSHDLSALAGETNIVFRFVFATDQSVTAEGAVIDNFSIDATAVLASGDFEMNGFRLYPNPSSSVFYIAREGFEPMQVSVYDVTGRLIFEERNIVRSVYGLDLSQARSGLYFLKVREGSKQVASTLLKQ